jgi:GNAT superfamily N-acetyltransferase
MDTLRVAPVSALGQEVPGQVRAIYEEAFPPALRVPFTELVHAGDLDQMLVALDGPAPVGLASLRLLPSASWSFLRYFAVAADRRSQGVGRQFWRLVQASIKATRWPARTVFEVEDPGEAGGDRAERLARQRRIRFWTSCGAELLPVPDYVLPDYTGCGKTEPVLLMASDPSAGSPCSGNELRSVVLAIYTDRYGLTSSDPLVTQAVASVPA